MSAKLPVDILIETVVDQGLCTRCGTCVGACPVDNVDIADPLGACLPRAGDACTSCGLCLEGCPGAAVEFAPLERALFGETSPNRLLGVVRNAYLAHATDAGVRRSAASGGVVTAMLLDLLRRGESSGAVLFAPHPEEPWRAWGRVAATSDEIAAAAQSRYHLSPLNTALADLRGSGGACAYVGLPCQIHGLRKLQAAGWKRPGTELSPVIGIYCGNNLYYEATRVMLRKLGVKRPEDVARLAYREGVWRGSFAVRTAEGVTRSISKLDFNQVIPFYINRRCLFCIDLTNELADLSVGDGWAKEGRGEDGWSVVLVRTEAGAGAFDRARRAGVIEAEPIALDEAERMHSHAFDLKKTGSFLRLRLWRGWGCAVPRYDRPAPRVGASRLLFEIALSLQFAAASSRVGRAVFRALPAQALGRFFRLVRKRWMRSTARR